MQTTQPDSEKLTYEKVWEMFQETDRRFKETDKQLKEAFQETNKQFKDTDKKLKKLEHLFTSQWGKLIESLIEGDLIKLLNERGIEVRNTSTRNKGRYNGKQFEIDIIAENGEEVVVVEVKTTLKVSNVNDFLQKLNDIKQMLPKYKNNKIIGAIAYLTSDENADNMALNNGLLVIKATGNSSNIINPIDFNFRYW